MTGAAPAGALAAYIAVRPEHLPLEYSTGAIGAVPPLVTTTDLAIRATSPSPLDARGSAGGHRGLRRGAVVLIDGCRASKRCADCTAIQCGQLVLDAAARSKLESEVVSLECAK